MPGAEQMQEFFPIRRKNSLTKRPKLSYEIGYDEGLSRSIGAEPSSRGPALSI
jgi:hypothetical protein